jgi:hypothetical protein
MMLAIVIEIAGWVAAGLFLLSYVLVSTGRLQGQSRAYQWLNVVGAIGFVINSGWNGAYPSAAVNVIWAMIGLGTLWQLARKKDSSTSAM